MDKLNFKTIAMSSDKICNSMYNFYILIYYLSNASQVLRHSEKSKDYYNYGNKQDKFQIHGCEVVQYLQLNVRVSDDTHFNWVMPHK